MAKNTSTSSKSKTKTTKRASAAAKASRASTKSVASTKTTKPAKAAKTTTVAKETKSTVGTAAPHKSNVTITQNVTTSGALRKFNLFAAAVLAVLAAVSGVVMKMDSYALGVEHVTKDVLRSVSDTVFVPAQTLVWDVRAVWVVAGIMAIAAIMTLLRATKLRAYERRALDSGIGSWRWIELSLTGALMVALVALMSGINSLYMLGLLGGFVGVAGAFAWMAERANAARVSSKPHAIFALLAGIVPFVVLADSFVVTGVYGMIRMPWYVYAAFATLLIGYGLMARVLVRVLKGRVANALTAERMYARLGLLTKLVFAVVLIVGLS